jgi:signal transduction histidine kinase
VVPVGSHGTDPDIVAQIEGTLDETPMAQRALAEDRVVEAHQDHASHVPARYARFAGITTITCTPIAAGGRWLGVIFADRGGGRFELTEDERRTMLTLGRLAALSASVERATRQREHARRLSERVSLTREIHEQVIQRLFGLQLVVGSEQPLTEADRGRVAEELRAVLSELRGALDRSLTQREHETRTTLRHLLDRLGQRPELTVQWAEGIEIPSELEPLMQATLAEALRNIDKHARPTEVEVEVAAGPEALVLEVTNDGAGDGEGDQESGLGLRLMSLEALQHRGLVEFGPVSPDRWRVRLVVPPGRR